MQRRVLRTLRAFIRIMRVIRNRIAQRFQFCGPQKQVDIPLSQAPLLDDQTGPLQFFNIVAGLPLRDTQPLEGLYRSWAIPCAGQKVYSPRYRSAWVKQLTEAGVRRRAEWLYQQLDDLQPLRREARRELLTESHKHPANKILRQVPWLGPIRVALLIALIQTPHRFRTKRQLWAYSGLALRTRVSGEYRITGDQLQRAKRQPSLRGLNENHNHELKARFKSTATRASTAAGAFGDFYAALLATGMRPTMARLTVARKIAAIVLTIWKKGERFDPEHLKRQTA